MDEVEEIALREKPKMILGRIFRLLQPDLDWKRFREIADKTGAYLFADIAHIAGLIAGKHWKIRCRFATWSPRPRTKLCAGRAAP